MSEPPLLDPSVLASLQALNPDDKGEFVREIAGIFIEDTQDRLAELDRDLAEGDAAKFARAAHSIKGSAANMGAAALGAAARRLEAEAKDAGLGCAGPLLEAVKAEFAKVRVELEKLRRGTA